MTVVSELLKQNTIKFVFRLVHKNQISVIDAIVKTNGSECLAIYSPQMTLTQCLLPVVHNEYYQECPYTGQMSQATSEPLIGLHQYHNGYFVGKFQAVLKNDIHTVKKSGFGDYYWNTGTVYRGNFVEDNRSGYGECSWNGGPTYVGDFVHCPDASHEGLGTAHLQGQGKITYPNGTVYEGSFHESYKSGQGRCDFANGDVYVGEWWRGQQSGRGVMTYSNGDEYRGEWERGLRCGWGRMRYASGGDKEDYEGRWREGSKQRVEMMEGKKMEENEGLHEV
jgi:hypothetical protein